jgi:hypothetical protein
MTRVRVYQDILEYQRQIATDIKQIRREYNISGLPQGDSIPPELRNPLSISSLLQPPRIQHLWAALTERIEESLIIAQIYAHDLDVWSVYVTIKTEEGYLIERGNAEIDEGMPGVWEYMPTISIPAGTTVIVQVFARDRLDGVGTMSEVTVVE